MKVQTAQEILKSGTDICLTLKWGYDHKGFSITTSMIFKAEIWKVKLSEFADKVKLYTANTTDHVICEA
jgi:hypothetical protein